MFKSQAAKPQIHYVFDIFGDGGVIAYSETLYCCHFVRGTSMLNVVSQSVRRCVRRHMAERSAILNLL